jgi:hypothetical protein
MGANEQLALEANLESWKAERAVGLTPERNAFEYYCLERFLQDWVDSDEEMQAGMIGGSQDGGVDGFYFFVNRELVTEDAVAPDPKTVMNTDLLLFQIKEGDGFSPSCIDKLTHFTEDLLDLQRPESQYHSQYRPQLLQLMRLFKDRYRLIVGGGMPAFSINYFYVSKKDVEPNADCKASEKALRDKVAQLFVKAEYSFNFVNATGLWAQVQARPKRKKRVLTWAAQPIETPEGFLGLVFLSDYFKFLTGDHGELNKRIFESNVRGYWQYTSVNKEILGTLQKPTQASEFWLLNNGITILVSDIDSAGYTQMGLIDPQIVNGLQTSRVIYSYYSEASTNSSVPVKDNRRILVRLVKPTDEAVRDEIIRATNRQNQMPLESLRATDEIHRQIEEHFLRFGLYYDRRRGHYRDEGKPIAKIVSIVEVLQGILSCILRKPDDARARPRNYFGTDPKYSYDDVFGDGRYSLNVYLKSVEILRRVEGFLDAVETEPIHRRNLKFYLCMYVASAVTKNAFIPPDEFVKVDSAVISEKLLEECHERVRKAYDYVAERSKVNGEYDYDGVAKGSKLPEKLRAGLKARYNRAKRTKKS